MDPLAYINFHSSEWKAIKMYLEKQMSLKLDQLVGAKDQDESQKVRGAIMLIKQLLALEVNAANRPQ